jgi:hypothetical protein
MTLSIDAHETRPAAVEVKFLLDPEHAARVQTWARDHLAPDPHGGGDHGDAYRTTTLYLDTADLDVFHRRGSYGRAKYRVRRYEASDLAFLERKLRRPRLLVKWRTSVAVPALDKLAAGGLAPDAPGGWFQRRIACRRLAPACVVTYTRLARLGTAEGAPVRLTLDGDLRAWPATGFALGASGAGRTALPGRHILELKYRGRLPAVFRRLVQDLALTPGGVSKYRLAIATVADLTAPDDAGAQVGTVRYA